MNISEAKITDAEAIYKFCCKLRDEHAEMSFAEVRSVEDVTKWIEDDHEHIFMMREANHIIALVKAKQGHDGREHSAFMSAAVLKPRRGEGLVSRLSAEVYPRLKERGIKIVRAYIYSNNHSSISSVLKEGFHCTGSVQMHHYHEATESWVDDLIFHKYL